MTCDTTWAKVESTVSLCDNIGSIHPSSHLFGTSAYPGLNKIKGLLSIGCLCIPHTGGIP